MFEWNYSGGPLGEEQIKSLWAFLGVALGIVATLIGALLTQNNQRRVNLLAEEQTNLNKQAERRQLLALKEQTDQNAQAEKRLTLETRVKALELISTGTEYATPARVTGAIATMMDLAGGPVTIRVLGELWKAKKVSTAAAVWMIDRVLQDDKAEPGDKQEAAYLLFENAASLVPAPDDRRQDWQNFPDIVSAGWPFSLPSTVRWSLLLMCLAVLEARGRQYWEYGPFGPIADVLYWALDDEEYGTNAALILAKLIDLGAGPWLALEDGEEQRIRAKAAEDSSGPWFVRLLDQLDVWEDPVVSGPH